MNIGWVLYRLRRKHLPQASISALSKSSLHGAPSVVPPLVVNFRHDKKPELGETDVVGGKCAHRFTTVKDKAADKATHTNTLASKTCWQIGISTPILFPRATTLIAVFTPSATIRMLVVIVSRSCDPRQSHGAHKYQNQV